MTAPATAIKGARALITGGLGFLGSNLARELVQRGAEVTIVDALISGHGGDPFNVAGIADHVRIGVFDLRDRDRLVEFVAGQDLVFDLAGQSSHLDSMHDPFRDLEVNCHARLALLEACRKQAPGARIVFASTRQVYGRPISVPVSEDHPTAPVDVNGAHKLAAEWYHRVYASVYQLHTVVLRLTNTYGPRMRVRDARQTFLGLWFRSVLQGRSFEVWGGTQRRDLNYVDDVVGALLLAAVDDRARGMTFNLGSIENISLLELAELLVRLNGGGTFELRPFPPERRLIDIGDYVADWTRLRRLGWTPSVDLADGIERTLRYYRKHGPHYWRDE